MGKLSVKKWMENLDCTYDEVLLDNNQICQLNKKNFNDARTNLNKIWENNRNINLQKYFNNAKDLIGKVKGRVNEFGKTITNYDINYIRININGSRWFKEGKGVMVRRSKVKKLPYPFGIYDLEDIDKRFDLNLESAILPYEVLKILGESYDGKFYFIESIYTKGYVDKKDIAIVVDNNKWNLFLNPEEIYVVISNTYENINFGEKLFMGTIIPVECCNAIIPVRNKFGYAEYKKIDCFDKEGLNFGYLLFTEENILCQAFKTLGDIYGWGGDFESRDCSSLINEIYRCFGIVIGRNASDQVYSGVKSFDLTNMNSEEKKRFISKLPIGSELIFPGHTTLYIGSVLGEPYILHALSSIGNPNKVLSNGSLERVFVSEIVISDTNIQRVVDGKTFIESFDVAVCY